MGEIGSILKNKRNRGKKKENIVCIYFAIV